MLGGSLCTGTGALDMAAASVLGCRLAWVADTDPGAAKLLAHRYPQLPNLNDIAAVDWVTDAPGLSRDEQLRALGNGCAPAQAEAALTGLLAAREATREALHLLPAATA
jgi:hypothetical protein